MEKIKFEIIGKPVGKGRPRLGRYGVHTPTRTVNYETLVKWTYLNKFEGCSQLIGPIKAKITAVFLVPKSYTKKQKQQIEEKPFYTHKPDCDNIAKIILDSLNGLAYQDDSQITNLETNKIYGTEEKVIIELEEI